MRTTALKITHSEADADVCLFAEEALEKAACVSLGAKANSCQKLLYMLIC